MIRSAYTDTRHGQVHYRYCRNEQTTDLPVVYLHKSASSSSTYKTLIEGLAYRFSGYALDTPGFGNSYDPDEVIDTRYYIDTLIEALDSIGLQRFHLVGHHTGACLGIEMAVLFPKRVASLVMIGPALLNPEERMRFRADYSSAFNQPVSDGQHLMLTWDYLKRMGVGNGLALHQREFLDHCRAWKGRVQAYNAIWDQDCLSLFLKVTCPMLATCAEDDVLWPYFSRVNQLHPKVQCIVTAGGNFEPDRDTAFHLQILSDFFQQQHVNN
ncbi:alpha/beta fold hydrolase [Pseudomonas sp. TH10]|uniref:alpha/beta fold hydrolase n=1 Tax=Pseudomonas sp. TH10 TaxID=2796376 RepID=UPI001F5B51B8|nr:alpha/beta hydrolase [Pseudomonas sp. TH10]